jgi:predicted aspartyl protease
MTRVSFDTSFDPPASVLPVRIGGLDEHDPAAMLRMLVDTGADCTLIPARIAKSLCLPMVDKIEIMGVGGKAMAAPVYAARIRLGTLRAIARLVALGDESLLGRDLLNRLILRIDGPAQIIEAAPRTKRPRGRP